jgi:hypothetical protein
MNTILQTNNIVRRAIMRVRISGGDPAERSALYDALNLRRNARAYSMPAWQRAAWQFEADSDIRNFGGVERTHAELARAVDRHRPTN